MTVPEQVAGHLRGLPTGVLVDACARLRPNPASGEVVAAAKQALRVLARRYQALSGEISELDTEIARLCAEANPALLAAAGVGPEVAATLLIAAGDNPERLTNEASFAALCGATPIEASSGRTVRHRLNRGGDRQANNALWRIAMVRLRCDERTKAYAARRTAQGKSRREILRCLKRYIAREIHQLLTDPPAVPPGAHLRQLRHAAGATIADAAQEPSTPAPTACQNSNEAPATTTTSPSATTTGSPKPPLDKHRSITRQAGSWSISVRHSCSLCVSSGDRCMQASLYWCVPYGLSVVLFPLWCISVV